MLERNDNLNVKEKNLDLKIILEFCVVRIIKLFDLKFCYKNISYMRIWVLFNIFLLYFYFLEYGIEYEN